MHNYCDGVGRRDVLRAGVAGAFGLSLPSVLQLDASENAVDSGKNAIFIFLTGGQSHIDTWDMKPDAGEMKGEFESIATNLPELRVCEHMPYLAKQADKYAIVRNVSHTQGAHSPGQRYLQTGNPKIPSLEYPDYGSVIAKQHQSPRGVPQYVLSPGGGSNSASFRPVIWASLTDRSRRWATPTQKTTASVRWPRLKDSPQKRSMHGNVC